MRDIGVTGVRCAAFPILVPPASSSALSGRVFFFQAEDGIRDIGVTGVQTCALPILIIRSGALATGGEVYVLEMGDPVKIVELARNMIRLSGREPDTEIAIEIVGRRPGEKIHEELFNPDERPQPTPAEKIVAAVRPPLDPQWVENAFARVEEVVYAGDARGLAATVAELAEERAAAAAASTPGLRT